MNVLEMLGFRNAHDLTQPKEKELVEARLQRVEQRMTKLHEAIAEQTAER